MTRRPLAFTRVVSAVSFSTGISAERITGGSRLSDVVRARHACWDHLSRIEHYSNSAIARMWGVDVSTVWDALRRRGAVPERKRQWNVVRPAQLVAAGAGL